MRRIFVIFITVLVTLIMLNWLSDIAHAETVEIEPDYIVTVYQSSDAEEQLWELISKYSPSDSVTAGILAYFWRESCYKSDSVAGWGDEYNATGHDRAEKFIPAIDIGLIDGSTRDDFINGAHWYGGYGLGQWWSLGYLEDLYDFAREWGTSISDAEMQCAFVVKSMKENEDLWLRLKQDTSAYSAGYLIAIFYDGSDAYDYMGELASVLYLRYADQLAS